MYKCNDEMKTYVMTTIKTASYSIVSFDMKKYNDNNKERGSDFAHRYHDQVEMSVIRAIISTVDLFYSANIFCEREDMTTAVRTYFVVRRCFRGGRTGGNNNKMCVCMCVPHSVLFINLFQYS